MLPFSHQPPDITPLMKTSLLADHFTVHQRVVDDSMKALAGPVSDVSRVLVESLKSGGKLICFGNGGSATQASHMAGELIGRFKSNRKSLPAIALSSDGGPVTCIANDFGFDAVFERQVSALAREGDVALGLSTSGRSENVLRALAEARRRGARTVALCGENGLARGEADHVLSVPSSSTAHVQEIHLILLHVLCIAVEDAFAAEQR